MYTAFNLLPAQRPSQRERMRMITAIGDGWREVVFGYGTEEEEKVMRRGGVFGVRTQKEQFQDANLLLLGVELFPESDAKLLAQALEGLEVLLVLVLVLDLGLDAC